MDIKTNPKNIKGMRGSWFATAPGFKEHLPIMWSYEYNGKTHILETGWMSLLGTETKRNHFRNFFKERIDKDIPVVLAEAKDKNKHPHEKKQYQGVFKARVIAYDPEIKLEFKEML
jgi:hypothetical protein